MYKEKAASKSKTEVITVVAIYHDVPTVPTVRYRRYHGTVGTMVPWFVHEHPMNIP